MAQVESQSKEQHEQKNRENFIPIYDRKDFVPKRLDLFQIEGLRDDMSRFSEALTNFGLMAGQLILLTFASTQKSLVVKVESFAGNEIRYTGQSPDSPKLLIGPRDSIEILQRGQKYGSREMIFDADGKWYGKTKEELAPHLGRLLAGLPVKGDWTRPDGSAFFGEVKLLKEAESKERKIAVDINQRSEKLERKDYKLGVTITDAMWDEMVARPMVGIRVDFDFINKKGDRINFPGRLYIDPDMNQLKYRFLDKQEIQQEIKEQEKNKAEATAKKAQANTVTPNDILIDAVRELKTKGFNDTWFDFRNPDKGIVLNTTTHKKAGFTAAIRIEGNDLSSAKLAFTPSADGIVISNEVKKSFEAQLSIATEFIRNNAHRVGEKKEVKAKVKVS